MSDWKIIQPQTSDITNLCTNPSFELKTTDWAAGSGWTLARLASSNYSFRGLYGGRCIAGPTPNTIPASYTPPTNLESSSTYHVCAWILVNTWGGGGNIRIASSNYSDITETYNYIYTDGTSPTEQWVYIESKLVTGTDVTGTIDIESTASCVDADQIFIDMVTITKTLSPITVFDGTTPGCYWTGAEHASTSVAPAGVRNVGIELDLDDDLNFRVRQMFGAGMPHSRHITDESTFGAIFRSTKTQPRVLSLTGAIKGTSLANYHSRRKNILDIIYPNARKEKYYFRYYGANSDIPVELKCVYDTGFDISTISADLEMINWRSIAHDPFWYELADDKVALDTNDTATFDYIAGKVDGDWTDISSTFNAAVHVLAYDEKNDILYAGGEFTAPSNYIAQYKNGAWSALSSGLDGAVYAIAIDSIGDVYIGGTFTDVSGGGGGTYNRIIKWDISGSTWAAALGTGMNNDVQDIKIDRTGKVYCCGVFTTANAVTVNRFTYWNGTTFVAMDSGLGNNIAYAMVIDKSDNVYIGGSFTTAGGAATTVNGVTWWDGSAYNAMGTGAASSIIVYAMEIDAAGNVYAGGAFTTMDGITVNKIAQWTGEGWYALDSGVSGGSVYNIGSFAGLVWVGGNFTSASGLTTADRLAIWNRSTWVHADVDLPGSPIIRDIEVINKTYHEDVYLAFSTTGSATYSADVTCTNSGSAPAYPILEIWNEGGSSNTSVTYLKNETTGATLWMSYTLQPEEKIFINFNPNSFAVLTNLISGRRYARFQPAGQLPGDALKYADASEMILGGSNTNFYLEPGDNIITCFTPDAAVTAGLYWRIPHWSVDGVAA